MLQEDEQSPDWSQAKLILIVEDADADSIPIVHILSQVTQHRVFVASDDRAALKFIRHVRPDMFILHCPDGRTASGLSRQLHTPVEMQAIPTIVVGTFDVKQLERFADEVRYYGLILVREPLQPGHLLSAIEELLP